MSTWETQELPVLRALSDHFAQPGARPATVADVARDTGLDEVTITAVLRVLSEARAPYVLGTQRLATRGSQVVTGLTDRAYHELAQAEINEAARSASPDNPPRRSGPLPPGALSPQ